MSGFTLYNYDPSMGAAVFFIIVFLILTGLHGYQMFRTRTWYFVPFFIGGLFECVGYIGRAMSASQSPNWTLGPYIMQSLLLLVAPALFAASVYMELGRIILVTDGEAHAIIRRRWLTKLFVAGDVLSFLVQSGGAGIMASGSLDAMHRGENIVLGGLVIQILFFAFFVVVASTFHLRLRKVPTTRILAGQIPWERHLYALYAGSLFILVRSVFRLVEYGQGYTGYIMSHEAFLYIFDGCLMAATMAVFAWYHPSEIGALLRGSGGKSMKHGVSVYTMV